MAANPQSLRMPLVKERRQERLERMARAEAEGNEALIGDFLSLDSDELRRDWWAGREMTPDAIERRTRQRNRWWLVPFIVWAIGSGVVAMVLAVLGVI